MGSRIFAETHIIPLLKMQGYVNEVSFDMRAEGGRIFPVLVNARRAEDAPDDRAYYRFTVIDYTLRKRFEGELIEARREAEETAEMLRRANEDLERFAHIASHDLQAPLNTVTSLVQLLKMKGMVKSNANTKEVFEMIVRNTRRMRTMIHDLLEYRRHDTVPPAMQPVSLSAVCAEAAENLRADIEAAGAEIRISESLPEVRGVPIRLVRLFQNLFSNALKYRSVAPPVVKVCSRAKGDNIITEVADNGTGFDPSHAEKIFGFMERLQSRDEIEGTGIGLSACRRIAEAHGGSIRAESVPGAGSVFFVELPAAS